MPRSRSLTRAVAACLVVALPVLGPLACGGRDAPTSPPTPTPTTNTSIAPAARAYLDTALLFTQDVFYYGSRIDWTGLRSRAFQRAAGAQKFSDTYAAIDSAIAELRDPHSFFYQPSQSLGNREDPATPFYTPAAFVSSPRVAYLWVPTFGGKSQAGRADTIQMAVAKGDSTPGLCGWILDLRGNPGGFWPSMLVGLSPLITPGRTGGFVERDTTQRYYYVVQPGSAGLTIPGQGTYEYLKRPVYTLTHPGLPIAILQGDITASAGEIIVMAFKEPNRAVRTFGKPTYGVTSQPYTYTMSDKASVQVTAALMFDRQLKTYAGGAIPPDQDVAGPTIRSNYVPGRASDAVIDAATAWLNAQPSCVAKPDGALARSRALDPAAGMLRDATPIPGARPASEWPAGRPTPWVAGSPWWLGGPAAR